ncbi:MAG: phage head spike fiber domain-containing protein [Sulfobacillus sp.]
MTTYTKPVAVNALARSVAIVTVSGSPALPDCYSPYLYTVGSGGLVQTSFGTELSNYLLYSQQIGGTDWVLNGSTVTLNDTNAPDGTTTATLIVEDTSNGEHGVYQLITLLSETVYTLQGDFSYDNTDYVALSITDGVSIYVEIMLDLSTGAVQKSYDPTNAGISFGVTPLANGFYRVWSTFNTQASTTFYAKMNLLNSSGTSADYTGNGTSGMYVWGAQIRLGSGACVYLPTTSAAVVTAISAPTGGFSSSAVDGIGGAWLCSYADTLTEVNAGLGTMNAYTLAADTTYTGCTVVSGSPYVIASGGQVLTVSGSPGSALVDVTPAFTGPAWGLQEYNGTLYTLLAAAAEIGELALSSATSGTQSTLAIPMTTPSCFAVSVSGVIGVGGWSPVTLAYGFSAFSYAAGTVNLLAGINQASNTVQTLVSAKRSFTVNQTLTGSGAPSGVAWTPTNEQLFVSDATNNVVTVYNLSGQTLASSQTLTVSGATSIAIIPNAAQALICQPSKNLVTVLNNANNVWTSGSTVAITNPIAVLALSDTSAVVADGAGLSWLTNNSGTWSVTATAALAYTPTALAMDDVGGVYVVGVSGSVATMTAFFSETDVGSLSWTGGAVSVLWRQGQIVVGDNTNSLARVIGLASGSYQQFGSLATPATLLTIGAANESLFLSDQTQSYQCQFGAPYQLVRTESGSAAIYTSSWSQTVLGIGDRPTAAVFDASGNLWVATDNNTVYEINGGGIVSTVVVSQNDGQNQSVPVGLSSLLWNSGHLYGSTCLKGGLVEVQ